MAGMRKSSRVSFEETCCESSDRWNRYAGLGKRVVRESEQVCWGKLGELLTANCCLQVREENKGQRPLEDEFPEEQLHSSCRSFLPRLHHTEYLAPDQKRTEAPMHWTTKLSLKKSFSKSSPPMAPSLAIISAFPVVLLWLW